MKKQTMPPARYALLAACMFAGLAQAQSINFSGDTTPTGNQGASFTTTQVIVGDSGTGALNILSGGQLASQGGNIGQQAGSTGTVVLDGAGSSWTLTSPGFTSLTVGNGGSGSLQVRNGASVSTVSNVNVMFRSGQLPGSSALVEVDGANSIVEGDYCEFGNNGNSVVRITNGGVISCKLGGLLLNGEVNISGAGSKWVSDTQLEWGAPAGRPDAVVTVGEGASIEAVSYVIPASNAAGITGPTALKIEGAITPGAVVTPSIDFQSIEGGVLNLNHSDASGNYQLAPDILGYGGVDVNSAGTTTLTGNNSYYNATNINSGLLRAGAANSLSPSSDFVVAAGGTLDTNTFSPTVLSLDNSGLVTMAAGGTSTVLTVAQNYTGNGGVIAMNAALADSGSPTQKLVVQGSTSGNTILNISNLGGAGAQTTGDGILVVQVDGDSNGTFSLPAPGYVVAGGFRYSLVQVGNNWFLQSENQVEAAGPEASVVCTPAQLSDSANQVATCTVTLSTAATADLPINLVLPAANPRYTTTCASPMVVAANATQASCTITATPNTTAGDGDVTVTLAIAPPTTADAYTPVGPAAQVVIQDANAPQPPASPTAVPTLGSWGLAALAALMAALGLRRSRKSAA
ncbi:IPTL-CTERM sorting domain-containing protein [Comamonas sp. MYb21]|uniref:IPTL-CTERM sorting domain-containing protein n=1 Tax=Comamonas sp. MYb21 TaxID=1848648 RepID=UPI0030A4A35D